VAASRRRPLEVPQRRRISLSAGAGDRVASGGDW